VSGAGKGVSAGFLVKKSCFVEISPTGAFKRIRKTNLYKAMIFNQESS